MPDGYTTRQGNGLSAVAANAAEASRTIIQDVQNAEEFECCIQLAQSAASNLTVTPYVSCDLGVTYSREQSIAVATGTGTLSDYTPTKAASGNVSIAYKRGCKAINRIKLVIAAASGGASDLISAQSGLGIPK